MLKINLKPKNYKHIVVRALDQRIDLTKLIERVSYLEFKLKKLEQEKRGKIK
jgi:hypothetical protein